MPFTNLKEQEKEQRRELILSAAEKMFFSRGYDNVSMDDIASEIGLNKATLYLYFKNKESLFFAVVLRGALILNAMIKERIKKCNSGMEIIDAIGITYFDFVEKHPDYSRAYLYFRSDRFSIENNGDLCDDAKRVLELRNEEFAIVCKAIESGMEEGMIRPDLDPIEVTVFLTLILKTLTEMRPSFKKVLEDRRITPNQFFKDVAGLVHHMLANTDKKDGKF
ncbi:MAG: DNA-binding transcriptional repressor FabR [Methanosaeta sp. PtaU1.Bin060]|nr:MAG: DNA-binding transcriptional repressor FabR [Methanosaeta sp. PtaU1.Bin060]